MPIVTVTQQSFSGGDEIARQVSARLGCTLTDRAALERVAAKYAIDVSQAPPPELGEQAPSIIERLTQERRRFSVILHAAVFETARQGDAVFLGYGAGFMLKSVQHVLRVRVVTPLEIRIARLASSQPGTSKEAATARLRDDDRRRSEFVRYLFHADWQDALNYDLVVNTEKVTTDCAVETILQVLSAGPFAPTAASVQRLADGATGFQIEARLVSDPQVATPNVRAQVERGVVTLTGAVWSEEEKDIIESVAAQVPGVIEVRNEVHLQPPPPFFY